MADKKYKYNVCLCADGVSTGTVVLTKEQARIVDFVTNPSNWNDAEVEEYSGSFCIDIDTPMQIESECGVGK